MWAIKLLLPSNLREPQTAYRGMLTAASAIGFKKVVRLTRRAVIIEGGLRAGRFPKRGSKAVGGSSPVDTAAIWVLRSAMDSSPAIPDSAPASRPAVPPDSGWQELTELFDRYRSRLRLMVHLRLDRRLQARVDSSDVLQEAFLEAAERYERYKQEPTMPLFLWLRFLVGQRLVLMHRRHLDVKGRAAGREVSLFHGALPQANSESLAAQLLGKISSPSQIAMRSELQVRLQEALNSMDEIDREVLVLRHFEQLTNVEVAQVLGLQERAASKRYITALRRLKEILRTMPGFCEDIPDVGQGPAA